MASVHDYADKRQHEYPAIYLRTDLRRGSTDLVTLSDRTRIGRTRAEPICTAAGSFLYVHTRAPD
jgi:hypothetical protein